MGPSGPADTHVQACEDQSWVLHAGQGNDTPRAAHSSSVPRGAACEGRPGRGPVSPSLHT